MDQQRIELRYNIRDYREIYYADGNGSVFTAPITKSSLATTVLSVVLSFVFYLFAMRSGQVYVIFALIIFSILALLSIIYSSIKLNTYFQWKTQVEGYLKKLSSYSVYALILTDFAIEIVQGNESTIEKWENIKQAGIQPNFISITNGSQEKYIFPSKGMREEEFESLVTIVRSKIVA